MAEATTSFDLVDASEQGRRRREADGTCGCQIHHKFERGVLQRRRVSVIGTDND